MAVDGKTVALAKLLHEECKHLLHLYTERQSLPSLPVSGGQLVSIPPLTPQLSSSERLCFLHAALRACLSLLEDVIAREDSEFSDTLEDEYVNQRRTVKDRLGHLVLTTERQLQEVVRCQATVTKVPDLMDGGAFALKKWILQVLQDLVHWSGKTVETLQSPSARTSRKAPIKTRASRGRGTNQQRKRLRK
ncbi:ciliary neurotrophic factor [Trichomycterus rosablanca]|uniref:ciliary neurotrophic factor n=1 Tax=Trichomycterus rosablanca TaxID=2290929 RepID=UPI002F35634B